MFKSDELKNSRPLVFELYLILKGEDGNFPDLSSKRMEVVKEVKES